MARSQVNTFRPEKLVYFEAPTRWIYLQWAGSMTRVVKLTLAYDGTGFAGWQRQAGQPSIQALVEDALTPFTVDGHTAVTGAGRTDAGVHALGQVASARVAHTISSRRAPARVERTSSTRRAGHGARRRAAVVPCAPLGDRQDLRVSHRQHAAGLPLRGALRVARAARARRGAHAPRVGGDRRPPRLRGVPGERQPRPRHPTGRSSRPASTRRTGGSPSPVAATDSSGTWSAVSSARWSRSGMAAWSPGGWPHCSRRPTAPGPDPPRRHTDCFCVSVDYRRWKGAGLSLRALSPATP